jgi:hypothetical protein
MMRAAVSDEGWGGDFVLLLLHSFRVRFPTPQQIGIFTPLKSRPQKRILHHSTCGNVFPKFHDVSDRRMLRES